MREYGFKRAGTDVVFTVQLAGKPSEIWIAPLDRSAPPRAIASSGENSPQFGPAEEILFRFTDGKANYLGRMNADGSGRRRVADYAIATPQTISPDRRWLVAITPRFDGAQGAASMAIPTAGGPPRVVSRRAISLHRARAEVANEHWTDHRAAGIARHGTTGSSRSWYRSRLAAADDSRKPLWSSRRSLQVSIPTPMPTSKGTCSGICSASRGCRINAEE